MLLRISFSPISAASSIDRFESILRITSPSSLDFPTIHSVSKELFINMFPRELVLNYRPANTLEALALANEYQLISVSSKVSPLITSLFL